MSATTQIKIDGLRRLTAAAHLEKTLEAVPGVKAVEIDHQNECAVVEHDGADADKLVAAITDEGLQARLVIEEQSRSGL